MERMNQNLIVIQLLNGDDIIPLKYAIENKEIYEISDIMRTIKLILLS
jgi:hypothetical protein